MYTHYPSSGRPPWSPLAWLLLPLLLLTAPAPAQPATTLLDFESQSGTLTTDAFLDSLGISFGTPGVTLQGLPPLVNPGPGPVTVFSVDGAPSGTQVAANCAGGIGCEFPGGSVLMEFAEPTGDVTFQARAFTRGAQFRVYGYSADGTVTLLNTVATTADWQTIRAGGAKGYVIDLAGGGAGRTFYLDDIAWSPATELSLDCGTGEELLDRLQNDRPFLLEYDRIEQLTEEYTRTLRTDDELGFGAEVVTIPVVVHVVYNTATENISDAQIQSQIDALNDLFRGVNAGVGSVPSAFAAQVADLQIQFALAQRDPNCEPTNGITRTPTTVTRFPKPPRNSTDPLVRNPVKFSASNGQDGWPSDQYLNIWVCDIDSLLGYASWPADLAARPAEDGVVMHHTAFGTTGTVSATYGLGRVCAHEIGHWLNLRHIWGDDGGEADVCAGSDLVDDTPNQGTNNRMCPSFPSVSCDNGPNGDMFMNHMDYTTDACRTMFTVGQHVRAAAALFTTRASIIGSPALQPPPAGASEPDLWSADTWDDTGAEPNPSAEVMYQSADIWVRQSNDGFLNQEHQNPVYRSSGEPNYVYVRIRNRGCAGEQTGTTNLYWAKAGSGLSWPVPWDGSVATPALMGQPIGSQSVTVDGGEFEVLQFEWVVPNPDDYTGVPGDRAHFCLLSRTETPGGMTFAETGNLWENVRQNNNIVWKNISVGSEDTGGSGGFVNDLIVGNFSEAEQLVNLQFGLPGREVRSLFEHGKVYLEMGDLFGLWKEGGSAGAGFLPVNDSTLQLIKPDASVDNLPLKVGDLYGVRVRFVPDATPINAAYTLNLTQVDAKSLEPIGGNQFWFRTLAKGIVLPGDGGGGVGDNSPPVFVDCPESVPQYCEFPVTVRVDMANVPTPDNFLGNFTAVLEYDPAVMEYTGTSEILSGYTGLINATTPGRIVFNGADADGREGNVPVFTARFRALAPAGTEVETDLSLRALAAATTFRDLLPTATVHACRFTIDDNQLLGDVNGDGRINSTDAALILAYSVGNPIPASARSRIDAGIGNVDGNGVTNPRDALIILTYDVGLPVDYPLGTATVCPGTDAAAQHDADGEEQSPTVPVEVVPEREGEGYLLPVRVDMRGSGERLGSYLVEMTWDPARWTFAGIEGGSTPGFGESTANLEAVGKGMIRFAHAYAAGGADRVHVGSIRLLPVLPGEAGEPEPEVSLGDLTAAGTFQPLEGEVVRLSTAVGDPYGVKGVTFEAFPNPFGARTSIVVGLTEPTALQLTVLDPRGRQVAELARGTYPAGEHRFDWTSDGTGRLPAGVYIARLQLGKQLLTRRLILLR